MPCVKLLIKHLVDDLMGSFLIDYMKVGHSLLYYVLLLLGIKDSIIKHSQNIGHL